jgi:RNA polymerase sigma-70 factor (ECF subfamily)
MTNPVEFDQEYLQRAIAFDQEALAAIYDAYYEPLFRYIARRVSDTEQARDLTGELFKRFLQALKDGRPPTTHLRAWLYRAAHNLVVDHYRRRKHRDHLHLQEGPLAPLASTADPLATVVAHMQAEQVRAALCALTPEQQQVIALKFLSGMSNKETALIMEKPIGAIKSLQHRALAALQRQLLPAQETQRR